MKEIGKDIRSTADINNYRDAGADIKDGNLLMLQPIGGIHAENSNNAEKH